MHVTEKMWIPEMIFGHLLTSSNYDDNEKKVTGGRNGYGAKLANIFSQEFTVETVDTKSGRKYSQTWRNNMYKAEKAKVAKATVKKGYTQITFKPDLEKFKMEKLDKDIIALMTKRVYDIAGCNSSVKVYLNGTLIPIRNFTAYCKLYLDKEQKCIFEKVGDRWEVCLTTTDGQPEQVSFVNSINTIRGGTHVQTIQEKVSKFIIEAVKKKQKNAPVVKPHQVKQQLWVFVNCLVENPTFDSQTKETLTTKKANFGSSFKPGNDFFKKINQLDLMEKVLSYATFKEKSQLKTKGSGKKKEKLTGIKKLSDANDAGTKKFANDCTLILTEGDSAKTLAISGLSVVGRDRYGVFPLKGKLLNVRDASSKQILENEEIDAITKILGLKHGVQYDKKAISSDLRYGKLMIMADQDHDGSHIKGLLINFIHHFWPSLIKSNVFLQEFITPIIKASKGKKTEAFFTMPEYESWKKSNNNGHGWKIKYYKGLGTSTAMEAKDYFKNLKTHKIPFKYTGPENDRLIEMAFSKKKADERKDWIRAIDENTFVDHTKGSLAFDDFINKELVLFSAADCARSIPSIVDGFKPGQRKILYCCFKRKLTQELKVAQLAGYVSEQSAYHHGEVSLQNTIINLAQNYVGSNNINLLYPGGQFGTRLMGGKDSASPRYIFTRLSKITRAIFPEADDHLLEYLDDDGQSIEPKHYIPILPMVLVNGSEGIGTGWSSSVPCYNPVEISENIRRLVRGEDPEEMHPWYNGFSGVIEVSGGGKKSYQCHGSYEEIDEDTIRVTELPVGLWTQNFKEHIESLHVDAKGKNPIVNDYRDQSGDTTVDFLIKFEPGVLEKLKEAETLEKTLKLNSTKFNTTNMHLFNSQGEIKKYDSAVDILREFFDIRLSYYHKRKEWLVSVKKEDVLRISNRVRFILMVIAKEIIVANRKKDDLMKELEEKKFDKLAAKTRKPKAKNAIVEDEEEEEQSKASYDYLLSMPLWNLTFEKVEQLKKEKSTLEAELQVLLETSKEQMWEQDLIEFEKLYEQFRAEDEKDKKSQRLLKVEGELKPKAKPRGRAAAKPKVESKVTIKEKLVKKEKSNSDDDFEEKPAPKRGAVKKEASKTEPSGSEAESPKIVAKARGRPKAAAKATTSIKDKLVTAKKETKADSDEEFEDKSTGKDTTMEDTATDASPQVPKRGRPKATTTKAATTKAAAAKATTSKAAAAKTGGIESFFQGAGTKRTEPPASKAPPGISLFLLSSFK